MNTIRTYAVGNGEITLTEQDAEELRIILQTDHLAKVISELIQNNKDCFSFRSSASLRHFVDELVRMNDDCINYDSSYFKEMLEGNIFDRAKEHNLIKE